MAQLTRKFYRYTIKIMRLMLENLPPSLRADADVIRQCLEAFDRVMPLRTVYLFGSHARGEAREDSDVDLCIVSEDAAEQFAAAERLRHAIWEVWPRPSFTLIPISPLRLTEKKARHDPFFQTILNEGIQLVAKN